MQKKVRGGNKDNYGKEKERDLHEQFNFLYFWFQGIINQARHLSSRLANVDFTKHTGIANNVQSKKNRIRVLGGVLEGNKAFWGTKQIGIHVKEYEGRY